MGLGAGGIEAQGLEDGDLMAMLRMRGRKAGSNDSLVIDPCDDLLRKVYLD